MARTMARLAFLLLGAASALKLHLRVSTAPAVLPVHTPPETAVVSTKLVAAQHRLRLTNLLVRRIKQAAPPVANMRAHLHRRSLHQWDTAVTVRMANGVTHTRLLRTANVRAALVALLKMADDAQHLHLNAQAVGLIDEA